VKPLSVGNPVVPITPSNGRGSVTPCGSWLKIPYYTLRVWPPIVISPVVLDQRCSANPTSATWHHGPFVKDGTIIICAPKSAAEMAAAGDGNPDSCPRTAVRIKGTFDVTAPAAKFDSIYRRHALATLLRKTVTRAM
jgi:hypothetical protein